MSDPEGEQEVVITPVAKVEDIINSGVKSAASIGPLASSNGADDAKIIYANIRGLHAKVQPN